RLLLLADTHVSLRARQLPDRVWAEVAAADLVVHAGDWVCADLLDELEERSAALLACYGNNDGPEPRRPLPEVATAEREGLRVGVVHERPARSRVARSGCVRHTRSWASWSSGTATSPGTPPTRACAC